MSTDPGGHDDHEHDDGGAHAHFDPEPATTLSPGEPRTPGWAPVLGGILFLVGATYLLAKPGSMFDDPAAASASASASAATVTAASAKPPAPPATAAANAADAQRRLAQQAAAAVAAQTAQIPAAPSAAASAKAKPPLAGRLPAGAIPPAPAPAPAPGPAPPPHP